LHEHARARDSPDLSDRSSRNANAQRSGAGWAEARDRFPGRVDRAPVGRGDGTADHRDSAVNGPAASPDPRPPARVSAVSRTPRATQPRMVFRGSAEPSPTPAGACSSAHQRTLRRLRAGISWQRRTYDLRRMRACSSVPTPAPETANGISWQRRTCPTPAHVCAFSGICAPDQRCLRQARPRTVFRGSDEPCPRHRVLAPSQHTPAPTRTVILVAATAPDLRGPVGPRSPEMSHRPAVPRGHNVDAPS
jgi:hypothetical protein